MDIISLLLMLVIFVAIVWCAFWVIDSAFPAPVHMPAKLVVGVIALLVLLQKSGLLSGVHI
jgi:hypothetical protein